MRVLLPVTLALAVCGCGGSGGDGQRPAPDFRLDTLAHRRFYLNAQRGKTVVLVFWTTDWLVMSSTTLLSTDTRPGPR